MGGATALFAVVAHVAASAMMFLANKFKSGVQIGDNKVADSVEQMLENICKMLSKCWALSVAWLWDQAIKLWLFGDCDVSVNCNEEVLTKLVVFSTLTLTIVCAWTKTLLKDWQDRKL